MLSTQLAATGGLPSLSGFYWFSPASGSCHRGPCEKREGEPFVRMVDGTQLSVVQPHDRFFGPMAAPDQKWTLYWRDGSRQVIEGENAFQAMDNAGMRGANPYRTLCVPGDDHEYQWDAARRDWIKPVTVTEQQGDPLTA